jgi:hypothetical protein
MVESVSQETVGGNVTVKMVQPCWGFGVRLGQMGPPAAVYNIWAGAAGLQPGQWCVLVLSCTHTDPLCDTPSPSTSAHVI